MKRMEEMLSGGTTLLFVSHNLEQVRTLCDHVIWLDHGETIMVGETQEVCDAYQEIEDENSPVNRRKRARRQARLQEEMAAE